MNAILGILCFFGCFFSIILVSIDVNSTGETYKLIFATFGVVIACILIPCLFNNLLFSFFKRKHDLNKKYLRNGYTCFSISFFVAFAILIIYTFYMMGQPPVEIE